MPVQCTKMIDLSKYNTITDRENKKINKDVRKVQSYFIAYNCWIQSLCIGCYC